MTTAYSALKKENPEQLRKTRWSKFKDLVIKHPETTAYATAIVASTAAFATTTSTPAAGIVMFSMLGGLCALVREKVFKPVLTKSDRIVTSVVANAGFIAGSAMVFTQHRLSTGTVCAGSLLASLLYKPVKEIVMDKVNSVANKIHLLASGAAAGAGMLMFSLGASMGGVAGLFNLNMNTWQRAVTDFGSIFAGIAVTALGMMAFGKGMKKWEREPDADKSAGFWYAVVRVGGPRKPDDYGPN